MRVGGQELADLSIEAVREHMLVNPYDGEIFAGTLRTNIDPSGTSRMVPEAVEASMLTDVVALHREGLDYGVRDRGANLSGGQRQRLSLARALAADTDVLVLHDPTTAVDAVTEQLIARNIAKLRRGRTTVVITSSPALLDAADRVLVLDDGVITAEDTHRNLLATDEAYCRGRWPGDPCAALAAARSTCQDSAQATSLSRACRQPARSWPDGDRETRTVAPACSVRVSVSSQWGSIRVSCSPTSNATRSPDRSGRSRRRAAMAPPTGPPRGSARLRGVGRPPERPRLAGDAGHQVRELQRRVHRAQPAEALPGDHQPVRVGGYAALRHQRQQFVPDRLPQLGPAPELGLPVLGRQEDEGDGGHLATGDGRVERGHGRVQIQPVVPVEQQDHRSAAAHRVDAHGAPPAEPFAVPADPGAGEGQDVGRRRGRASAAGPGRPGSRRWTGHRRRRPG